jgi:hypothetical protein
VEKFEKKNGERVKDALRPRRLLCPQANTMGITRTVTVVIETVETLMVWRRPTEQPPANQGSAIAPGGGPLAPASAPAETADSRQSNAAAKARESS